MLLFGLRIAVVCLCIIFGVWPCVIVVCWSCILLLVGRV